MRTTIKRLLHIRSELRKVILKELNQLTGALYILMLQDRR